MHIGRLAAIVAIVAAGAAGQAWAAKGDGIRDIGVSLTFSEPPALTTGVGTVVVWCEQAANNAVAHTFEVGLVAGSGGDGTTLSVKIAFDSPTDEFVVHGNLPDGTHDTITHAGGAVTHAADLGSAGSTGSLSDGTALEPVPGEVDQSN